MSTAAATAPALVPTATAPLDAGVERRVSSQTWRAFIAWTALFWGGGILACVGAAKRPARSEARQDTLIGSSFSMPANQSRAPAGTPLQARGR